MAGRQPGNHARTLGWQTNLKIIEQNKTAEQVLKEKKEKLLN